MWYTTKSKITNPCQTQIASISWDGQDGKRTNEANGNRLEGTVWRSARPN